MQLVGIVNITPDSFSDGGQFLSIPSAIAHTEYLIESGADVIDVGAESTRPGAVRIPASVQLARLTPYLIEYQKRFTLPLSIDTTLSEVARVGFEYGASWINDTSMLRHDPNLAHVVASHGGTLVINHSRHDSTHMQNHTNYGDSIEKVVMADLMVAASIAEEAGVTAIILDPGIGFGKTATQCIQLLQHIDYCCQSPYPIMVGTSRKSWIKEQTGDPSTERIGGSIASVIYALERGVKMARVHDIVAHRSAILAWQHLKLDRI